MIKYGNTTIIVISNIIKWNLTIVHRVFIVRVPRSSLLISQQQLHNDSKDVRLVSLQSCGMVWPC